MGEDLMVGILVALWLTVLYLIYKAVMGGKSITL